MGRKPFSHRLFRTAFCFSVGFLGLFSQTGSAQDALNFFKNYFVTGDYVAAGVGFRATGSLQADPCQAQLQYGKPKLQAAAATEGTAVKEWNDLSTKCPQFAGM